MLKLDAFKQVVYDATELILRGFIAQGTIPARDAISFAWQRNGRPWWRITDNVCIITLTPVDNYLNKDVFRVYTPPDDVMTEDGEVLGYYTQVWQLGYVIYGPDSLQWASSLYYALSTPQIRELFTKNYMDIGHKGTAPRRMPELMGQQWWERVNMDYYINQMVSFDYNQPYFRDYTLTVETDANSPIKEGKN